MFITEIKPLYKQIIIFAVILYGITFSIYSSSKLFEHHQKILYTFTNSEGYGYEYIKYFDTVYFIKPLEPFNVPDFFTASFLYLCGIISFLVFFLLNSTPSKVQFKKLHLLFCAGFFYLGFDELFQIHEAVGLNAAHLLHKDLSGAALVDRDLNCYLIILYGVIAVAVFLMNWRYFLANWIGFGFLVIGGIFQTMATVIDYFWNHLQVLKALVGIFAFVVYHDEFFEMDAAFCYFTAILIYSFNLLSKYYEYSNGNIDFLRGKSDL
jgi:hypothetical protein